MRKAAVLNWIVYLTVRLSRRKPASPRWKVGIYKVDRLGDFILSINSIRAIAQISGEENCVLFHSAISSAIARREFPRITRIEVPPLDGKLWVTWYRMRLFIKSLFPLASVEQMICLRHFRALFDDVALQMIPAKNVLCVRNSTGFPLSYELVKDRFEGDMCVDRPILDSTGDKCEDLCCHAQLLQAWCGTEFNIGDLLPVIKRHNSLRRPVLTMTPFGSDSIRDVPIDCARSAVEYARSIMRLDVVLVAPAGAAARYDEYARQLASKGFPVRVETTQTTDDFIRAIETSAVILTAETATAHLATALDLPMVCLLGGGHFGLFAPWQRSTKQIWLSYRISCFNCNWLCIHPEPYCLTRISSSDVTAALDRVHAVSSVEATSNA